MPFTLQLYSIAITIVEFADYSVYKRDMHSVSILRGLKWVFKLDRLIRQTNKETLNKLNGLISDSPPQMFHNQHTSCITKSDSHYMNNSFVPWEKSIHEIGMVYKSCNFKDLRIKGCVVVKCKRRMLQYVALHTKYMYDASCKYMDWVKLYGMYNMYILLNIYSLFV